MLLDLGVGGWVRSAECAVLGRGEPNGDNLAGAAPLADLAKLHPVGILATLAR